MLLSHILAASILAFIAFAQISNRAAEILATTDATEREFESAMARLEEIKNALEQPDMIRDESLEQATLETNREKRKERKERKKREKRERNERKRTREFEEKLDPGKGFGEEGIGEEVEKEDSSTFQDELRGGLGIGGGRGFRGFGGRGFGRYGFGGRFGYRGIGFPFRGFRSYYSYPRYPFFRFPIYRRYGAYSRYRLACLNPGYYGRGWGRSYCFFVPRVLTGK